MRCVGRGWLFALLLLSGCSSAPPPPVEDTGSHQAVTDFFQMLVTQDWQRGFALLTPEKRSSLSLDQFKAQALAYRKRIGFEPEEVLIRSSEEHGNEAIAHLSLVGHVQGQRRLFRESVVLKRRGSDWFVIPPNRFGSNSR